MKEQLHQISYFIFQSTDELDEQERILIQYAMKAMQKAYAPYSGFHVGAALRFDDGTIISGNNQENAAYPSGLCAERVALFHAGSQFPEKIITHIAVVARPSAKNTVVTPCGACRQVMIESQRRQQQPIRIILASPEGNGMIFSSVESILPFAFDL